MQFTSVFVDDISLTQLGDSAICRSCPPDTYSNDIDAGECAPCTLSCPEGQTLQGSCDGKKSGACIGGNPPAPESSTGGSSAVVPIVIGVLVVVIAVGAFYVSRMKGRQAGSTTYSRLSIASDDIDGDFDEDSEDDPFDVGTGDFDEPGGDSTI